MTEQNQQPPQRKMCPDGEHIARAIHYEFGTNEKNNTFIRIKFQTKPPGGVGDSYLPFGDFFFTEKTIERTKADLERLGWDGKSSLTELNGFGTTEVLIAVVHETYTPIAKPGEPAKPARKVAKVQWINSLGGIKNKATPETLRELDMMLGLARSRARGNNNGAPAQENKANYEFDEGSGEFRESSGTKNPEDDDIPF